MILGNAPQKHGGAFSFSRLLSACSPQGLPTRKRAKMICAWPLRFWNLLVHLIFQVTLLKNKTVPPQIPLLKKRFYLFIFREKGREGERERKKHRCEREILTSFAPWSGTQPTTQTCALHRNPTRRPFALREDAQAAEPHGSGQPFS